MASTKVAFYESQQFANIQIFLPDAKCKRFSVDISQRRIRATADGIEPFDVDLLYPVDPQRSSFRVDNFKCEIRLAKLTPDRWGHYRDTAPPPSPVVGREPPWEALCDKQEQVEVEQAKERMTAEDLYQYETDERLKTTFANADPMGKRAMLKSFYESNGTVIESNWYKVANTVVRPADTSFLYE